MRQLAPVLLLLCSMLVSTAGTQASPPVEHVQNHTVSGRVVNEITGSPVSEANVTLTDTLGGPLRDESKTDSEGNFLFADLPDGKYELRAAHPGYLSSAYLEHEGFFCGVVVAQDAISTGLTVTLPPEATIAGVISDEAGDPVPQAVVTLYRQSNQAGKNNISRVNGSVTDDIGHFEIPRLTPANYFLSVRGRPWYASSAQYGRQNVVESRHRPLDVAFATTFYPDTTDSDAAAPLAVKAGDHLAVNVTMHAVPAIHIRTQVPASQDGRLTSAPSLESRVFGEMERVEQSTVTLPVQSNGMVTIETTGVAPGQYEVEWRDNATGAVESSEVNANTDLNDMDKSSAQRLANVDVSVAMEDGSHLPQLLGVVLWPEHGGTPGAPPVDASGVGHISGVTPGTYEVRAGSPSFDPAVKSVTARGASVEGSVLKVGSKDVMLAVILQRSDRTLNGFAMNDGKPAPGVMIVLIPKDPVKHPDVFRRDETDSDGSYSLKQVMPGEYTLVAIADGWSLEWARPEVMQHYAAQGIAVFVGPGEKNIHLKTTIEVQPR